MGKHTGFHQYKTFGGKTYDAAGTTDEYIEGRGSISPAISYFFNPQAHMNGEPTIEAPRVFAGRRREFVEALTNASCGD